MLRHVGFHEEYDGVLIDRLIQVMDSDDFGYSDAMDGPGWYAASFYASAVLGGEALHYRRPDTGNPADRPATARSIARPTAGGSGTSTTLVPLPRTRNTRWPCPMGEMAQSR